MKKEICEACGKDQESISIKEYFCFSFFMICFLFLLAVISNRLINVEAILNFVDGK